LDAAERLFFSGKPHHQPTGAVQPDADHHHSRLAIGLRS
jgi:hypothetical protein